MIYIYILTFFHNTQNSILILRP